MDHLYKFLSVDICDFCDSLLGLTHCPNSEERVESSGESRVEPRDESRVDSNSELIEDTFSYTIRHKYPNPLVTYDAEEAGEPRLIRYSDLSESLMDLLCSKCEIFQKTVKQEVEETINKCSEKKIKLEVNNSNPVKVESNKSMQTSDSKDDQIVCHFLKSLIPGKQLSEDRLQQLETSAKILHKRFIECKSEEQPMLNTPTEWMNLSQLQKFCFYWQALTGHLLQATPYENFRNIFIRRFRRKCPLGNLRELEMVIRRCWDCLKTEERVPFILNALLYHVSSGQVDPFDHCAVRGLLNRWR